MIEALDLQSRIESHLLVENKERQLVRFLLNPIQQEYNLRRTKRDLILKPRQLGFTTFVLAEFTIEALMVPNTRVVIVAQEKPTAAMMLRKVSTFLTRFYADDVFVPVDLDIQSKSEILIKETNSTIYIGTAGSRMFGRGDTVHRLLLTEAAKYENPDEIFSGIVQAVPASGRIVIETTANGYNYLRNLWYNSKQGQTIFTPQFFPWFSNPEYQAPGELENPTQDELEAMRLHPEITPQKLLWYRAKTKELNYSGKDPKLMRQEYPATPHEAFIASGNKVFSTTSIEQMLKLVEKPLYVGNISQYGKFSTDPDGFVQIFELPQVGQRYTLGADPSEGLSVSDPAAAVVLNVATMKIAAVWHGHKDPDLFGEDLTGLGIYYGLAVVGPESNNHGIATIIRMRDLGYRNIYTRTSYDTLTERNTEQLGWRTDLKTKPMMINELKSLVRERQINIPDERILTEMLAFEEKEPSNENAEYRKLGAALGSNDDLVIATAIAVQLRKFSPSTMTQTENLPTSYLKQPYGRPNTTTGVPSVGRG